MPFRNIITYPHMSLYKKSSIVTKFDESLKALIRDMVDTMNVRGGVGLAANQIGVRKRVVILKVGAFSNDDHEHAGESSNLTLINPELTIIGEKKHTWEESCLSVPYVSAIVSRHANISIVFQDIEGETHSLSAEGALAAALQHECDHLDGKLFLRRISRLKKNILDRKIKKRLKKERALENMRALELKKELADIHGLPDPTKKAPKRVKKTKRQKSRKRG